MVGCDSLLERFFQTAKCPIPSLSENSHVNSHAPWEKIRTVCGPRGLLWMLVNRGRRALEIRIPLGSPMEEANIFPWRTRIYAALHSPCSQGYLKVRSEPSK